MRDFLHTLKRDGASRLDSVKLRLKDRSSSDFGGMFIQIIITVAAFSFVVLCVLAWTGNGIINKGADASACVEGGVMSYSSTASTTANCKENLSQSHSFKTDNAYKTRY